MEDLADLALQGAPLQVLHHCVGDPGEVAHVPAPHATRCPRRGSIRSAGSTRLSLAPPPPTGRLPVELVEQHRLGTGAPPLSTLRGTRRSPRRWRPCRPASGRCYESRPRASRDLGEPRTIQGPSGGQQQGWLSPPARLHSPEHTALLNLLPTPRRPTAEDGKTPGFPRSETQPSRPRGTAPLSTVLSLLSSVTAREDTKGPDSVGPPRQAQGARRLGGTGPEVEPDKGGGL